MINSVSICGNLTRDMEVRHTASGFAIGTMGVAVNDRTKNSSTGEWEDYVNFFDVTLLGKRAESLEQYLTKGTKVCVSGKLRWSQWERDGQKRSKVEIVANEIEFMSRREDRNESYSPASDEYNISHLSADVFSEDIPF